MILLCALLNAWAGGSLWPSQYLKGFWTNLPEIALAVCITYGSICLFGWWGLLGALCYLPIQSGTWILLPWRTKGIRSKTRTATLKPIADWIAFRKVHVFKIFGQDIKIKTGLGVKEFDSAQYAAIYGAVKGFLITLPIGGAGAIYLPLSYEIGQRISEKHKTLLAELVFGAFIGWNIWILM